MSVRSEALAARATARLDQEVLTVAAAGTWQVTEPRPAWNELLAGRTPRRVALQTAGVERWDSSLLLFLFEAQQWCRVTGADCDIEALPAKIRELLGPLAQADQPARFPRTTAPEKTGAASPSRRSSAGRWTPARQKPPPPASKALTDHDKAPPCGPCRRARRRGGCGDGG